MIAYTGGGYNEDKIKGFHYIGSDISNLMNEGAQNFHSGIKMDFSTQSTIAGVINEIKKIMAKNCHCSMG